MATHYFFGIHVPEETRAMILANRELQTAILPFKKQTHPSDYHITLKFFGQLSDELRNELIQSASELANKIKPFMIDVEGIETFGLKKRSTSFIRRNKVKSVVSTITNHD
ncbi:2'-5' RNA ligase family protein [Geomicrobium sp. JCM 19055]|uniref:2'-5' RNA ligase family protein n=1 Tax=Geomicrobium sp. JCM 19055 TaxID=1460649 RepID=UPI00045ED99F|nr:2'-5' RNA ligase family protein [Geomicrobium sp. JCM 19055]GAJ99446.1 2'-5' RNA ligase [Geomicrobium sp. JCM 19055]